MSDSLDEFIRQNYEGNVKERQEQERKKSFQKEVGLEGGAKRQKQESDKRKAIIETIRRKSQGNKAIEQAPSANEGGEYDEAIETARQKHAQAVLDYEKNRDTEESPIALGKDRARIAAIARHKKIYNREFQTERARQTMNLSPMETSHLRESAVEHEQQLEPEHEEAIDRAGEEAKQSFRRAMTEALARRNAAMQSGKEAVGESFEPGREEQLNKLRGQGKAFAYLHGSAEGEGGKLVTEDDLTGSPEKRYIQRRRKEMGL